MSTHITNLKLSVRAQNCIYNIMGRTSDHTVEEFIEIATEEYSKRWRNCGIKTQIEIRDELARHGYEWGRWLRGKKPSSNVPELNELDSLISKIDEFRKDLMELRGSVQRFISAQKASLSQDTWDRREKLMDKFGSYTEVAKVEGVTPSCIREGILKRKRKRLIDQSRGRTMKQPPQSE